MVSTAETGGACRSCGAALVARVLELGMQPTDDSLVDPERLDQPDEMERLQLFVCTDCWLLQAARRVEARPLSKDHGHGAAQSSTMRRYLTVMASELVGGLGLDRSSLVLDVSCGDGSLLREFDDHGVQIFGLEPDRAAAASAAAAGVPVMNESFGPRATHALDKRWDSAGRGACEPCASSRRGRESHTREHRDRAGARWNRGYRIPSCPRGIERAVRRRVPRPPLLLLAHSLERALQGHGLTVVDVELVATYGGSVRALAKRSGDVSRVEASVQRTREIERSSWTRCLGWIRGTTGSGTTRFRRAGRLPQAGAGQR